MEKLVRAATFEVVLKKPVSDPLTYEKPLPLELIPFKERTDPYRSLGTAFYLGANTYATAAHVFLLAVDSQYGAPLIRSSSGQVYAIRSILKLSVHEDFALFSLAEDPSPPALETNRSPKIDDPVFAVGNALGEGIVIRDGLFTSQTPEIQDGRWQWIRFSAAASPGNSGGPLLDAQGRVIGLVTAKSPNENLNYALPVANILDAPAGKARADLRFLASVPFMHSTKTYRVTDEFALPLDWASFQRAYQNLVDRHDAQARQQLLTEYAASQFPKGPGSDAVIYEVDSRSDPAGILIQQPNGQWTITAAEFDTTDLPQDGKLGKTVIQGVTVVRLERGAEAADDAFYADSKAFMDLAAQTLDIRRQVGTDSVRVTSLGSASSDSVWTDHYGRKWQLRTWPLPFMDGYAVALLLPTPDGYLGLVSYTLSPFLRQAKDTLTLLAGQVTTPYQGTLHQWQTFLHRRALLPRTLEHVTLDSSPVWRLSTPRFESAVPASVLGLTERSRLTLKMGYIAGGPDLTWEPLGVRWYRDRQEKASVNLWRQPRPPDTTKSELKDVFDDIQESHSPYDGNPVRISSDAIEVTTRLEAPGTKEGMASADLVYGLRLQVDGHPSPQQLAGDLTETLQATKILEHGGGQDVAAAAPATLSGQFDGFLKATREMAQKFDAAGRDVRGRLFSEDLEQYITPLYQEAYKTRYDSAEREELHKTFNERSHALSEYWGFARGVVENRDIWVAFLAHNHLPADTPHGVGIATAEANLNASLKELPNPSWARDAQALTDAYVGERSAMARKLAAATSEASVSVRARQSPCLAPTSRTSGNTKPSPGVGSRPLTEFYPEDLRRRGVEGLVVLAVQVNSTGCVEQAGIEVSSGADELDQAALRWVETNTFYPAEKEGKAVDGLGSVALNFKLHQ
ncbi:MAG: TonB family protein [Proteobacteria bacterium]|nr:TonB family protein [Pseudomonadota bacterium]